MVSEKLDCAMMGLSGILRGQTLVCVLVISLASSTVIQCTEIGDMGKSADAPKAAEAPKSQEVQSVDSPLQTKSATGGKSSPKIDLPSEAAIVSSVPQSAKPDSGADSEGAANARKGRSEPPPQSASTDKPAASAAADKEPTDAPAAGKQAEKSAPSASTAKPASEPPKGGNSGPKQANSANKQHQLSGKSGTGSSSGKKLPPNLGTVTSTGSGGPAHYMSKHDAYSAIAEKHGALAQDAMRKADKRQHVQRFGGIQKASGGLSDALSPFKGVTDSGLARTLGASMRSIMKGKYSVPAYVASAVLGAVALMAFYESPISPLPVPALPEPPVGRFPPEMPNISPNLQVPFRMNQQQQQQQHQFGHGYQRSSQPVAAPGSQQVLFPGASTQQRQSNSGPIQQLAANLMSTVNGAANMQTAQRKSGIDYEPSTSRSFFGSPQQASSKIGPPVNSQQMLAGAQHAPKTHGGSFLSFFGFGGDSATPTDVHRVSGMSGHQIAAGGGPIASGGEQKAGQSALSNSHLINKMKSYFDRPMSQNIWPSESHAPNQYDQYRRMSIVQALAKDTAFLSSFFTPSRRSSNATSAAIGPLGSANLLQQSVSSILSSAPTSTGGSSASLTSMAQPGGTQSVAATSRMQVDGAAQRPSFGSMLMQQQHQQQSLNANTKRASSGYGLMRAAHALLDTFSSSLLHRSSASSPGPQSNSGIVARKSEDQHHQQQQQQQQLQQQNAIASATSLLSEIMSSYDPQNSVGASETQSVQTNQVNPQVASDSNKPDADQSAVIGGRTASQSAASANLENDAVAPQQKEQQQQQQHPTSHSQAAPDMASSSNQPLVRKTRSIGLDYPTNDQAYQYRNQQQQEQPSKASQINNMVDIVSDSYKHNKILFNFFMKQVGLSHAIPYVDQFLGSPNEPS